MKFSVVVAAALASGALATPQYPPKVRMFLLLSQSYASTGHELSIEPQLSSTRFGGQSSRSCEPVFAFFCCSTVWLPSRLPQPLHKTSLSRLIPI